MSIFTSLSGVFSCMIMIGLGYYLTRIGWFDQNISKLFSKMAMVITIPLYMVSSMIKSYTKEDLLQLGIAVTMPFVTMLICWGIGIVASFLFNVPQHRRGAFQAMFFVANTAFIGFPVNIALFGDQALPIAVMYYLVQSILFWTIGAYGLGVDGARMVGLNADGTAGAVPAGPAIFSMTTLKKILSPPLIGAIVAILLILGGIKLPKFAMSTCQYLGGMTTPLAMLFIGIAIFLANLRSVRLTRDMVVLLVARFLIAPAVVLAAVHFVPVPELMKKVFVIEASMPVMTQVSIAAKAYGADANYVAVMTAVTTVLAMITIPTYFLLVTFKIL